MQKQTEPNQVIWLTYVFIASKVKDITKYTKITVLQNHIWLTWCRLTWAETCGYRMALYHFFNNISCALKDMSLHAFTIESTQQDATNESLECGLMMVVHSASTNLCPANEHWHMNFLPHVLLHYEDQQYVYAVYGNTCLVWESKQTHRHSVSQKAGHHVHKLHWALNGVISECTGTRVSQLFEVAIYNHRRR
jgi:hypothetical protein